MRIQVLTLNCWGLKYVAAKRKQRLDAIADWILNSNIGYDVIALQEIWVKEDFLNLREKLKEAEFFYALYFESGVVGSGLAILSMHPVLDSFLYPYALTGYPLHVIEGDYFAAKAVCGATIDIGGSLFQVLNTHLYAPGGEGDQISGAHRMAQIYELSRMVRDFTLMGRNVVVCGDFNTQPTSTIMRFFRSYTLLTDSFMETHKEEPSIDSDEHAALTSQAALRVHGITCDSPLNTWSAPKLRNKSPSDPVLIRGGKRLDYVFHRGTTLTMKASACTVVLTDINPTLNCSYSDHFGLHVELTTSPRPPSFGKSPVIRTGRAAVPSEDVDRFVSNLRGCYRYAEETSRRHLIYCAGCVVVAPALAVGASFQPLRYLSWLFVLLATAAGALGATFLYTGFVCARSEISKLKVIIRQLEYELVR